jgi:hypothetical protein
VKQEKKQECGNSDENKENKDVKSKENKDVNKDFKRKM